MTDTESRIQQQCVMWYRNTFCLRHHEPRHVIFSIPNERESEAERIRLSAIGLLPGVADLCVLRPDGVWFVEVKTPTGAQSKAQRSFQEQCASLGFRYDVVRSFEEFQNLFGS